MSLTRYKICIRLLSFIGLAIFFLLPSQAHAFATLVQSKHVYPGQSATFDNPVTEGNLIVVLASGSGGPALDATCDDSLGNTYTKVGSFVSNSNVTRSTAFYSWNVTGGTNTVSTTLTATGDIGITILEYAGIRNDIDPLDTYSVATGSVADPYITPLTTTAKDLIVYFWANENANYYVAPTTGYTEVGYDSGHYDAVGQLLTAAAGSHSPGVDVSANPVNETVLIALAFKVKREVLSKPPNNLGLLSYWSMEDARGTKATDSSGNGYTGTLGGDGGTAWVSGKRGKAVSFGGGYIDIPSMTIGVTSTFSVWVRPTDTGTIESILSNANPGGVALGVNLFINTYETSDATIHFEVGNGSSGGGITSDAGVVTFGAWNHIAFTATGGNYTIYLNGVPIKTGSDSINWAKTGALRMGSFINGGFALNGAIDEFRIYNRALTDTEVAALYGTGIRRVNATSAGRGPTTGLVGHWTFDGQHLVSATSTDVSGQSNDMKLFNAPSPTIGKLGQALLFNGSSTYASRTSPLATTDPEPVSFCAWFKANSLHDARIVGVVDPPGGSDANNSMYLEITSGGVVQADKEGSFASGSYTANNWYHACAVFNIALPSIYINGVFVDDQAINRGSSGLTTLSIGARSLSTPGSYFNGSIDDVRVYNRALTAAEVSQLYRMGVSN